MSTEQIVAEPVVTLAAETTPTPVPEAAPEPAGATATAEPKKPHKKKTTKVKMDKPTEETAEEKEPETSTEPNGEEKPKLHEPPTPKVGRGGVLGWFKRMARGRGDHPRLLARSPKILAEAGITLDDLTEDILRQATKECAPLAEQYVKSQIAAGNTSQGEWNEKVWFAYGTPESKPVPQGGKDGKTVKPPGKPRASSVKSVNGLNGREVNILKMLAGSNTPIGRQVLEKQAGASSKLLGAATKPGLGVQGGGLEGRGFIKSARPEGERQLFYAITPEGKKALKEAE